MFNIIFCGLTVPLAWTSCYDVEWQNDICGVAVSRAINELNISQKRNLFIWFLPKWDFDVWDKNLTSAGDNLIELQKALLACKMFTCLLVHLFPDRLKTQNFRLKIKLQFDVWQEDQTRKTENMLLIMSQFH